MKPAYNSTLDEKYKKTVILDFLEINSLGSSVLSYYEFGLFEAEENTLTYIFPNKHLVN